MKLLATIALLLTSLCCQAAEPAPSYVASYTSQPGESMDAFALRIAPEAVALSMQADVRAEVCGEFYKTADGYGIEFYTIHSVGACSYSRKLSIEGYTGLSYHTHIFIDRSFDEARLKLSSPRFSDEDYAHPGYLASGKKVLFQNGMGTERRVR